jgi:hypothetical protein
MHFLQATAGQCLIYKVLFRSSYWQPQTTILIPNSNGILLSDEPVPMVMVTCSVALPDIATGSKGLVISVIFVFKKVAELFDNFHLQPVMSWHSLYLVPHALHLLPFSP